MNEMPFDRELIEARLTLELVGSDEMPKLAWDALEAGLDGPAIRRLAALEHPTFFEVNEVLPNALDEMQLKLVTGIEAAPRLAKSIAQDILKSGADPLRHNRMLERLWIRAGYPTELAKYGTLHDEVSVARQMGQSDAEIRVWVVTKLKELAASDSKTTC
jgi:hypothetical protein